MSRAGKTSLPSDTAPEEVRSVADNDEIGLQEIPLPPPCKPKIERQSSLRDEIRGEQALFPRCVDWCLQGLARWKGDFYAWICQVDCYTRVVLLVFIFDDTMIFYIFMFDFKIVSCHMYCMLCTLFRFITEDKLTMDALTMAGRRLSTLQQDEYVDDKGFNKHRSLINCILRLLHNFLQPVKLGEPLSERKKFLHAATLMLPQNKTRVSKLIASGYSPRLWENAGSDTDCSNETVQ